jgi:hypothetical protein
MAGERDGSGDGDLAVLLRSIRKGWGGGLMLGSRRLEDVADEAATRLTALQAENEALRGKMRAIVSHATGGSDQDIDAPLNDISVRITQNMARYYDGGKEAAQAENEKLREALEPFARLQVPRKAEGNAGFYSLRFRDIERARAALQGSQS